MSELKFKPPMRKMSLDEAVNNTMTPEAWKAYIDLHEVAVTRRDD